MKLHFLGAAGSVTGSCFLVEVDDSTRFVVDCGLFQGSKLERELNDHRFEFDPSTLSFVLLTHAHIDHCGRLPALVKHGFRGPIHMTPPTADLLHWLLPDSARIQESDVQRLNRRRKLRGDEALEPLYSEEDAARTLTQLAATPYDKELQPAPGVRVRFHDAGHVLGSSSLAVDIETAAGSKRLVFSGDIGSRHQPLVRDPEPPLKADVLIMESTYGDRRQAPLAPDQRVAALGDVVEEAFAREGTLVIPAFALERTQVLLHDLQRLMIDGRIPRRDVYVDSPLATRCTATFEKYRHVLDEEASETDRLSMQGLFKAPNLHHTESVADSKSLNDKHGIVILSASGMCDAGRIQFHLRQHLPDDNATVLLVGYQAPGTLGRFLEDGRRRVRIHGREVRVRATVLSVDWYSGHADGDGLLDWRSKVGDVGRVFLVHGEERSRSVLRKALEERFGDRVFAPMLGETYDLTTDVEHKPVPSAVIEHFKHPDDGDSFNQYAQFVLDLSQYMREEEDEEQRVAILRKMAQLLKS